MRVVDQDSQLFAAVNAAPDATARAGLLGVDYQRMRNTGVALQRFSALMGAVAALLLFLATGFVIGEAPLLPNALFGFPIMLIGALAGSLVSFWVRSHGHRRGWTAFRQGLVAGTAQSIVVLAALFVVSRLGVPMMLGAVAGAIIWYSVGQPVLLLVSVDLLKLPLAASHIAYVEQLKALPPRLSVLGGDPAFLWFMLLVGLVTTPAVLVLLRAQPIAVIPLLALDVLAAAVAGRLIEHNRIGALAATMVIGLAAVVAAAIAFG